MNVEVFSQENLAATIASRVADLITQKLRTRPSFNLVLTGGTLGIATAKELGKHSLPWEKVDIWFGDERFVQLGDPDRNEDQAVAVWPSLQTLRLHRFPSPTDGALEPAAAIADAQFEEMFGEIENPDSVFDLVLLGMGPDGHVASLFPGHEHPVSWVVSESNSPKPPSERLSLSYQALNRSDYVWFIASGSAKSVALRRVLTTGDLPAAKVTGGLDTRWFIDQELSDAL